ncbi:phosphoribosylaminoimidazole carboxylase [Saccharomycopsis crataegensis]|uniref:Phosphoribosylaminoimidazole carboxylase n=1 Tax=Saccharomycopsis crataegensis TaxID=43959 RepID=A0AAV5QH96_9ASCO|nr:phosphoribosylaminoimidazole carboxylase [Saccharomycopsis crataegensis]
MDSKTVGILGGGQLGLMLVEAANRLNVKTVILDAEGAPAKRINASEAHINGSFKDAEGVSKLASKADVLTIEIEHVNTEILSDLQKKNDKIAIHPSPETIKIIQDKYTQKEYLIENNVAVAESIAVENTIDGIKNAGSILGYPFLLKARNNAYDGRGNFVVKSEASVVEAQAALGANTALYGEKFVPFVKELAVMVVKDIKGDVYAYPTVETIHTDNICHIVYAPARVPDSTQLRASLLAQDAVKCFPKGAGIFGVEMFLLNDGQLLVNEIAPRPHNSGHYTIDACVTSQFEALIRAVTGLPLPKGFSSFSTPSTNAIMLNVLGADEPDGELEYCKRALETPGASVYLYGKSSRPKRKVGHINIVGSSLDECQRRLDYILGKSLSLEDVTQASKPPAGTSTKPLVGVIMGSDSDLPVMSEGCNILKKFGVPFEVTIVSAHRTPHRMSKYAIEAPHRGVKVIIAGAGGAAHLPGMVASMTPLPVVGVPVKGSRLDGVDSLYSIVQMPRGIPVATVAINNSTNAALLAIRILGAYDNKYHKLMQEYAIDLENQVTAKAEKLETVGYENY